LPGIIAWTVGDRSAATFVNLWKRIKTWGSYFYITDDYVVYKKYLPQESHIISKTGMTQVEGQNTRLRHYLARLKRKCLCYSKNEEMLKLSLRLVVHYLKTWEIPLLPAFIS